MIGGYVKKSATWGGSETGGKREQRLGAGEGQKNELKTDLGAYEDGLHKYHERRGKRRRRGRDGPV